MPHKERLKKRRSGKRDHPEAVCQILNRIEIISARKRLFYASQSPFRRKAGRLYHAFVKNSNRFKPFCLDNRAKRPG